LARRLACCRGCRLPLCAAACGGRHSACAPGTEEQVLTSIIGPTTSGYHTIAEFERRTHIKVVYELYDSNQTLEAKMLSGRSGYDIVSTTTAFYGRQIQGGAYCPSTDRSCPTGGISIPRLAIQSQADPGNRYAVPYLHAMNGFVTKHGSRQSAHAGTRPRTSGHDIRPQGDRALRRLRGHVLGFAEDVISAGSRLFASGSEFARVEDLQAAERAVMRCALIFVRSIPNDYWHQLASKEICLGVAWSSDYSVAQARAREDGTGAHLAFTLAQGRLEYTYNAFLIRRRRRIPGRGAQVSEFYSRSAGHRRDLQRHHYGNDNLAARPFVKSEDTR